MSLAWNEQAARANIIVARLHCLSGVQAIVVRLYRARGADNTHAALDANGLLLRALTPGRWGNALRARIDHNIVPSDSSRFNLTVRDCGTGKLEIFRNLSWRGDDARRADVVVAAKSRLVSAALPSARPRAHANLAAGRAAAARRPVGR